MANGITIYYDTLTPRSRAFPFVMTATLDEILQDLAEDVEAYAKENAPWQDQTGEARDGLTAEAISSFVVPSIVLYHTVDYGIWLEVKNSGEYAIIIPTLEQMGPEVMARVSELFILAP